MSTSSADITARPLSLSTLLDGIERGTVVLPDFQRDFLWSEEEVAALIATAMMGWPAGSLLLMRGVPKFFNTRTFENVSGTANQHIAYVVLDGQQRLTALYRALRGVGDELYVIDLSKLPERLSTAEEVEEAISVVNLADWRREAERYGQGDHFLVPLTSLRSASDFFEWRDEIVSTAVQPPMRDAVTSRLTTAFRMLLGTINHYEFPAVILENDLPTEAVARIFERINRGGLQLSTFDLLVARAYTRDWNLRLEWDRARAETELIETYLGEDGLPVLQALALREVGDVRRPALLNLPAQVIQSQWEEATVAMDAAARFVAESGMRNPDWLPYRTLLIPLAALARSFPLEAHRAQLEAWLWSRSLGMEYDVASSTKLAADYAMLAEAMAIGQQLRFDVHVDRLETATRRQDAALWRSFMSLLLRNGARDLITGDELGREIGRDTDRAAGSLYLRTRTAERDPPHLRVLSQVLIRRGGAERFRGQSLLSAVAELTRVDAELNDRLATQFVGPSLS